MSGYTDVKGTVHLVSVDRAHHDYWTAAGELKAACSCGWWDHHSYSAGGEEFARMKLQFRATDHVPELAARA
jgi:hypothetical protein